MMCGNDAAAAARREAARRIEYGWQARALIAERERDEAREEAKRLRALYENAVGNRERFGWTINHLLECEDALACVEAKAEQAEADRDALLKAIEAMEFATSDFKPGWKARERLYDLAHAIQERSRT